jgi:hypothetical protein
MYAPAYGIDIADLQSQTLAKTQAQAIDGEKEDPVTECELPETNVGGSSTVTISGKRWALGGLIRWGATQGLRNT